jgi:hypothetical protein
VGKDPVSTERTTVGLEGCTHDLRGRDGDQGEMFQ